MDPLRRHESPLSVDAIDELPELTDDLAETLLQAVGFSPRTVIAGGNTTATTTSLISSPPPPAVQGSPSHLNQRRLKNQRKYSRKLARRRGLEDQVRELELQLRQLILSSDAKDAAAAANELSSAPPDRSQLEHLFPLALRTEVLLREENAALRRQFMVLTQLHQRLGDILMAEHSLCLPHSSLFVILKPLTREKCIEKHAEVEPIVTSFLSETMDNAAVSTVCGWRGIRSVEGNRFKFVLQKRYQHVRAEELCDLTFGFLLDPTVLSQFYSESLNVRLRTMQRVGEDSVVFFEELVLADTPTARVVSKSILLLSRLKIDTGYRISMRCLSAGDLPFQFRDQGDPRPDVSPGRLVEEFWKSRLWWIQLEDDGDGCIVSYAGLVPISGSTVWFLMGEVLVNALRWELKVKGSPFGLRV